MLPFLLQIMRPRLLLPIQLPILLLLLPILLITISLIKILQLILSCFPPTSVPFFLRLIAYVIHFVKRGLESGLFQNYGWINVTPCTSKSLIAGLIWMGLSSSRTHVWPVVVGVLLGL